MNAPLIVVDTDRHTVEAVQKNGKSARIALTAKERGLLTLLAKAEGKVVTRAEALAKLWDTTPDAGVDSRTVDQHMARLRGKIGATAGDAIQTITGAGYKVEPCCIKLITSKDLIGRIRKVVPVIDETSGVPKLDITYRVGYMDPRPKMGQQMRLAEVR